MPAKATVRVRPIVATSVAAFLLICPGAATAKELTRLWYFGGNIGFHSTQDSVGSNAALPANPGAAFANDPRPDSFQNREISVEDGLGWSITAGYGMTRMLSFQLDLGYYRGDVGDVDVYLEDTFPIVGSQSNPTNVTGLRTRETTVPVTAGELTQVPVTLSAILRFRPTATVNPWISAGFGRVFTEVTADPDLPRLNDRLKALRIRFLSDEFGEDITPARDADLKGDGKVPMRHPVSIEVEDGNEWHLAVGVDYFLNDRLSVTADIRYVSVDNQVVIDLKGQDQVNYFTFSEKLFRKDGSLKYFSSLAFAPNPLINKDFPALGRWGCLPATSRDFDRDGHRDDLCFRYDELNPPYGTFVVQGGEIDLSGFAFNVGLRFHF